MDKSELKTGEGRWLLLLHHLPAKAAYLRVKVWRALQAMGAIRLKHSTYMLPASAPTRRQFEHLLREIDAKGGEGAICEAEFLSGVRDDEIRALFNAAREADYDVLIEALRLSSRSYDKGKRKSDPGPAVQKFRRRLDEIERVDFFSASGRIAAETLLAEVEHRPIKNDGRSKAGGGDISALQGRTWVTRQGIYVDRIACAWLIGRFIDRRPRFKFVTAKHYEPAPGELRYDMHNGEFTHEGDKCSFEVLLERLPVKDPALKAIAEIIHDIDLKDRKFNRPETAGIAHVIAGICRSQGEDEARMARGRELFDNTYEQFRRADR
jgi:hypothetical protein